VFQRQVLAATRLRAFHRLDRTSVRLAHLFDHLVGGREPVIDLRTDARELRSISPA